MPPPKGLATLFNPLLSSLGNSTSRVGLSSGRIELIGIHQQQQQRQHFQYSTITRTSAIDIVRLKQGRRQLEATTRRRSFSSSTSIHVSRSYLPTSVLFSHFKRRIQIYSLGTSIGRGEREGRVERVPLGIELLWRSLHERVI